MLINLKKFVILSLILLANSNVLAKTQTYIFVSFSMPYSALKSYFVEAQQEGAILVMRGLKDNSFLVTKAKATELEISFNIDPNLFEQYQITTVPVIITDDNQGAVKKLTGHLSLHAALAIMEKET